MNKTVHYYVCGHTAAGYVNFLKSNLHGVRQTFILKHQSNSIKTKIMRRLINIFTDEAEEMEIIHNSYSQQYIDGIIMRDRSVAILSDDIVDFTLNWATIIDLDVFLSKSSDDRIKNLNNRRKKLADVAYIYFNEGLKIHDDLEQIYIDQMDFKKADHVADEFINKLFHNVSKQNKRSHMFRRLFGTNTGDGVVNLVEKLIEPIKNRVYIKGRAGTGKSVFMKKVLTKCKRYGINTEVYHCSFDPNSIDMLIIRDLDYCLFDSTPPHEFFPKQDSDQTIDLYELTVEPGTDEQFKDEINIVTERYKERMKKGVDELRKIKELEYIDQSELHRLSDEQFEIVIEKLLEQI